MKVLATTLRLLADETRLRVLRLLAREELNAGELTRILGLGQPAVSRQIGILREAGLVEERRDGRYAYYRLASDPPAASSAAAGVWETVMDGVRAEDDEAGDLARLAGVLRERRERQVGGGEGAGRRPFVPGRSWAAWARALTWLVPSAPVVLDLGCGDGALTLEIARFAREVTGVDVDAALLRRARATARRGGARNARFRRADLLALPFDDAGFDVAVMSQTLHHVEDAAGALDEAHRVLRPAGRLLLLDLRPHEEEWVRDRLGHRHLGFDPAELARLLRGAGFRRVRVEPMDVRSDDPFHVLLATGEVAE